MDRKGRHDRLSGRRVCAVKTVLPVRLAHAPPGVAAIPRRVDRQVPDTAGQKRDLQHMERGRADQRPAKRRADRDDHRHLRGNLMSDQPGYTRLPNDIIEAMPYLGNGELRVLLAIARKTIGYQKESDRVSVSQIETLTGLAHRHALSALKSLVERGFISQEQIGKQSYKYSVKPVPLGNQLPTGTSTPREPEPVPLGNQFEEKPVPLGNTQKKDLKEKKESSAGAKSAARTPREKKEKDPTPEPIVLALADACKIDRSRAPREQRQQLYQSAGILYRAGKKAGQDEEQIAKAIEYVAGWFKKHDWRGQKGQAPAPAQVREVWRQAIDARNGHGSYPIPPTVAAAAAPKAPAAPIESRRSVLEARMREAGK